MQLLNLFYLVLRNKIEKSLRCWIHCVSNAVLKRPTIASFCSRGICLCESITHLSGVSCWEGLKFSTHRWESSRGCNSLMRGRLNWQEVQDSAVRAIPVIGVKLTDVQKIMKTAMSLVKNTIILHESSKCVCISMLETPPPPFFLSHHWEKTSTHPSWKHQLTHWPMQLKWGLVLGVLGAQGRGYAGRLLHFRSPLLPQPTHWWIGGRAFLCLLRHS